MGVGEAVDEAEGDWFREEMAGERGRCIPALDLGVGEGGDIRREVEAEAGAGGEDDRWWLGVQEGSGVGRVGPVEGDRAVTGEEVDVGMDAVDPGSDAEATEDVALVVDGAMAEGNGGAHLKGRPDEVGLRQIEIKAEGGGGAAASAEAGGDAGDSGEGGHVCLSEAGRAGLGGAGEKTAEEQGEKQGRRMRRTFGGHRGHGL
jgi:hypothetical protein